MNLSAVIHNQTKAKCSIANGIEHGSWDNEFIVELCEFYILNYYGPSPFEPKVNSMNEDQLKEELSNLLKGVMEDTGKALKKSSKEIAQMTVDQAKLLAGLRDSPDFDFMVKVIKNNIAMQAGLAAVAEADAVDARIHGVIETTLSIASKALLA